MNSSRDSLSETLRGWRVAPPSDPSFRQRVWERIGKQVGMTWPAYLRTHVVACSLSAAVVMGAAALAGGTVARAQVRAERDAIVVTYLVDLDPRVQAILKP
jgi:hypothetical protein